MISLIKCLSSNELYVIYVTIYLCLSTLFYETLQKLKCTRKCK